MTFQVIYEVTHGAVLDWDSAYTESVLREMEPYYAVATIDDDALRHWLDLNVVWPPYALLNPDGQTFSIVRT